MQQNRIDWTVKVRGLPAATKVSAERNGKLTFLYRESKAELHKYLFQCDYIIYTARITPSLPQKETGNRQRQDTMRKRHRQTLSQFLETNISETRAIGLHTDSDFDTSFLTPPSPTTILHVLFDEENGLIKDFSRPICNNAVSGCCSSLRYEQEDPKVLAPTLKIVQLRRLKLAQPIQTQFVIKSSALLCMLILTHFVSVPE